ncbi:MAG TPA: MFS transporter [Candidatus Angelobacter sp.]|jgi:MFS family permease
MPDSSTITGDRWHDFWLLWGGQTLSLFGDQFLVLALPILAIQVLGVSAAKAALLPMALFGPFLILGLPVGAFVDRLPRRWTMIACDSVQTAIYAVVALFVLRSWLNFSLLMVLVATGGAAMVIFQVAYTSYVPSLFASTHHLHSANARLAFSESASRTVGPMAAGPVIAWVGLTAAMGFEAATFLVSVLSLLAIRHRDTIAFRPIPLREYKGIFRDIREGMVFVLHHPVLEPLILCGTAYVVFCTMAETCLVLYCLKVLHLNTTAIGLMVGAATAGFPLGNLISVRFVRRLGGIRTAVVSACISVLGLVFVPVMGALGSITGLVLASIVHGLGEGIFSPTATTLRQTETPEVLRGRMNSVQRFCVWGATPIGSLLTAGAIHQVGVSGALWIGGLGTAICLPVLLRRGIAQEVMQSLRPVAAPDHAT